MLDTRQNGYEALELDADKKDGMLILSEGYLKFELQYTMFPHCLWRALTGEHKKKSGA